MTRWFWRSLMTALLLATFSGSAYAQGMGSIFGKVTDSSGAVMPGVTVTVTGTGLQLPRVAVTTETGAYQFPNIPIGTYAVTFELQGFKKATRPDIIIVTGFNAPIDQALEVGTMTEEVTVSGETPIVDTAADDRGRHVRRADAREDSDRARPLDGHLHGAGRAAQRHQRRRLRVRRAADDLIARHQRERPVESRRRGDDRPAQQHVGVVLQLRRARADSGDQRRRRRIGAVERHLDQPDHQERQQHVQGIGGRHADQRRDAVQQRVARSCSPRAPAASCRARRSIASPT